MMKSSNRKKRPGSAMYTVRTLREDGVDAGEKGRILLVEGGERAADCEEDRAADMMNKPALIVQQ
jgi:hypothetical protein